MAAADVQLVSPVLIEKQLDTILQEVANVYSKENLKRDIEFTKKTLGGEFLKFPDDDITPCLKELRNQGRITPQKTGFLEYYAKGNESIAEKIKRLKSQSTKGKENDSEFVGRDEDIAAVVGHLTRTRTSVMALYGDPGVGKTTLADKIAELLKANGQVKNKRKIDLRKKKSGLEVCLAILQALNPQKVLQPCIEFVFETIENLEVNTLLIFDNAEELLTQALSQERTIFLCDILKGMEEHDKSNKLSILLTSRVPLPDDTNSYINYHVQPLKEASSATVLEKPNVSISQNDKNEIIELCKNKPLLLQLVAASMQENLINTQNIKDWKRILVTLEKGERMTEEEQTKFADNYNSIIFNEVFQNFTPELKKATIKLTLFQGSFTAKDAVKMIKQRKEETLFYLNTLRDRNFLQERSDKRHIFYEMHPTMNEFLMGKCQEKAYKDIFTDAKETFFKIYLEKSRQIAQLLEKDYVKAYSFLEKERLNLKLSIDISFEMGFLYFSSDYSESTIIADLFLVLIPGSDREKLFRQWSIIAEEKGEWICYSNLVCMQVLVLLEKTAGKAKARELLRKVEKVLNSLDDKSSEAYQLVESSYLYAKGEILGLDCETKHQSVWQLEEGQEVLNFYQKSLEIRQELLKDHTETARTLNAIGNCYMYMEEHKKALEYYTEALEMRQRLSCSQEHVDMPVYINQIGTVHEMLGNKYKKEAFDANLYYRRELTQKYRKEFNEALKKYQEALDLEKKLHIFGYRNTATFYRNMSNAYSHLEEYESSLTTAKKALSVRKKLLGIDSDTIRSYYQVGLTYEKLDEIEKALKYFYKAYMMERELPEGERSPVWERVLQKIKSNLGSTEEAETYDKRHREALQKGSLDDEILTSEEEKEEEDDNCHSNIQLSQSDESSSELEEGDNEETLGDEPQTKDNLPTVTNEEIKDKVLAGSNQGKMALLDKHMESEIEIEEGMVVDSQTVGVSGLTWDIKETGVRIVLLPGTVQTDTNISCHTSIEPDKQLPLEPVERLVSRVVKLDAENSGFNKEIGILIPHCGPSRTKGYELVVKEYSERSKTWEEVEDFVNILHKTDLQDIDSEFTSHLKDINVPAVLLARQISSTVCVTCRLVQETLTARPTGSTLMSSVFPEVQLLLEKNTVKKNTPISMKVHPLPNVVVFNSPNFSCGPVLYLQTAKSEPIDIHKPMGIVLPHPLAWYDDYTGDYIRHGQVRVLYNTHSDNSSIEWQDITDNPSTNVSVNGSRVSFKVQHFSMFWLIWISDVKQDIQKLLSKAKEQFSALCRFPPMAAQFCVTCRPRIRKAQAILQCTVIPKHIKKRDKLLDDSDEDLYDGEEILVELKGSIKRNLDPSTDDQSFFIKFSSKKRNQKSMSVVVEEEDGTFYCHFLRVLHNNNLICEFPFNLPSVPEDNKKLKPIEFFGIPLEDPDNKWKLLETPKSVLVPILQNLSLHEPANIAFGYKDEEEGIRVFYESLSHTDLQQEAFDAVVLNLPEGSVHVKRVLEAGKRVVEKPLDKETAKSLSKYIKEDYIKLAQVSNLSTQCEHVKKMKGTSEDRCFILLQTWIKHEKKPTLHVLMGKLIEAGCEKGMEALLKHFEDRLETERARDVDSSTPVSDSALVTFEGRYEEAPTPEPLLAGPHIIDIEQAGTIQNIESEPCSTVVGSSNAFCSSYQVTGDVFRHPCHSTDESNVNDIVASSDAVAVNSDSPVGSVDYSTTSVTSSDASEGSDEHLDGEMVVSDGDSLDCVSDIINEQAGSNSLFYTAVLVFGLSLCYIFFRYTRR